MKNLFLILLIVCAVGALWIRFAPTDKDRWHVDPASTNDPAPRGYRLIGPEAPRFQGTPDQVLTAVKDVALLRSRVRLLDGGLDEGMMTFVARSKYMGFRDYITVKAVPEGSVTKLSVISRARYQIGSDWGINRMRLERWLAEVKARLPQG